MFRLPKTERKQERPRECSAKGSSRRSYNVLESMSRKTEVQEEPPIQLPSSHLKASQQTTMTAAGKPGCRRIGTFIIVPDLLDPSDERS